ncbi:MAG TPA: hypothetical protein VHK86_08750 [Nitrososphaera sp.]|jgi:hypothetical protein|nr:hypothetical protein [Nitrososphaera sp.]
MAKFYSKGPEIFQEPEGGSMGFRVAICDNGDGNEENNSANAKEIVRCLNQDDDIKELATWLLKQKTVYLNKKRVALLERILGL